jgi:hypothetical protein
MGLSPDSWAHRKHSSDDTKQRAEHLAPYRQSTQGACVIVYPPRQWRSNWSFAATFESEFSNVTSGYAGKGAVRDA